MPSSKKKGTATTQLAADFTPGDNDVIVGRGKVCYQHNGNLHLNKIVASVIVVYSDPDSTKKSKSDLIKSLMQQVRENSPQGGFVKFDSETGRWFEVGDRIAREKVSQCFRDALNDQYRSSTTSKTLKRRQERINRQTSCGSKDGDSATGSDDVPEAQARVDSLIKAAGMASTPSFLPSGMPTLPHAQMFMNPYLASHHQGQFFAGHPGMMGAPHMPMAPHNSMSMNPSMGNPYMSVNMGNHHYDAMLMNNSHALQQHQAPLGFGRGLVPHRPSPALPEKQKLEP